MKTKYAKYENIPAIGAFPISNYGGLEILAIGYDINDYVIACFNYGDGRKDIRRHKIQVSNSGRLFIRKYGVRYYLDQIMKMR